MISFPNKRQNKQRMLKNVLSKLGIWVLEFDGIDDQDLLHRPAQELEGLLQHLYTEQEILLSEEPADEYSPAWARWRCAWKELDRQIAQTESRLEDIQQADCGTVVFPLACTAQ